MTVEGFEIVPDPAARRGRCAIAAIHCLWLLAVAAAATMSTPVPATAQPTADPQERARRAVEEQDRIEAEQRAVDVERRRRETNSVLDKVQEEATRRADEARRAETPELDARRTDATSRQAERQRDCTPIIAAKPLAFRRIEIDVSAACAPTGPIKLTYGRYTFTARLDAQGEARTLIDAFLPDVSSVGVSVAGGAPRAVPLEFANDRTVTKVAIVWRSPVNLDLHALEYAARRGGPGHVWANAPSTPEAALRRTDETGRGRGFLTMLDHPTDGGDRAEIYTFVHPAGHQTGTISLSLDFESRSSSGPDDFCGSGPDASVPVTVHVSGPGQAPTTEQALIPAIPCGPKPNGEERYLRYAVPDLRLH